VLKALCRTAALAGGAIALAVGLMTMYSVLQRALLSKPLNGDIELVQLGIALSISLCLGWCQYHKANIIVDFFTQKNSARSNQIFDAFGHLLLGIMYALLAWRTSVGAFAVHEAHEASIALDLPVWWTYACLAPGLALAACVAFTQFISDLKN
jgi:TRAP-type C4-dicarboxylate transport system permease small subunit